MEKKNNKSIVVGITSLLLVMLLLLGLTYAYYRTRIIGNESPDPSISVQSKKMEITYQDGTAEMNMTGKIEPGFIATKTFTVENTGNQEATYSVIIDNVNNTYTRDEDWTYTLTENGTPIASGIISSETNQILALNRTIQGVTGTINTYVLTVNYLNSEEDQSIDMGKQMSFRVNIVDNETAEDMTLQGVLTWDTATEGSLLYALKTNQPTGTEETTPGQAASTANEARILTTEDDYATSYVYRGNVQNNYVNFAGMCWRVVRVDGNSDIKLILEDKNYECNDEAYTGNWTVGYGTFGYVEKEINGNRFEIIQFVGEDGYMAKSFKNYQTTLAKKIDETLGENPTSEQVKNTLASKLIAGEWCYDDSVYSDEEKQNKITDLEEYFKESGASDVYYGGYFRTKSPSLKCEGTIVSDHADNENNPTPMYVATLTYDEVLIAGRYLSNSYSSNSIEPETGYGDLSQWWTMTPSTYINDPRVYGNLGEMRTDDAYFSYRPSIILKSNTVLDTTVTGQNGTIDNPYVIG